MKYAIIDCGRITTNHLKAVINNNNLEFVAACDLISGAIESLLVKHVLKNEKSIDRYNDYKKCLSSSLGDEADIGSRTFRSDFAWLY